MIAGKSSLRDYDKINDGHKGNPVLTTLCHFHVETRRFLPEGHKHHRLLLKVKQVLLRILRRVKDRWSRPLVVRNLKWAKELVSPGGRPLHLRELFFNHDRKSVDFDGCLTLHNPCLVSNVPLLNILDVCVKFKHYKDEKKITPMKRYQ